MILDCRGWPPTSSNIASTSFMVAVQFHAEILDTASWTTRVAWYQPVQYLACLNLRLPNQTFDTFFCRLTFWLYRRFLVKKVWLSGWYGFPASFCGGASAQPSRIICSTVDSFAGTRTGGYSTVPFIRSTAFSLDPVGVFRGWEFLRLILACVVAPDDSVPRIVRTTRRSLTRRLRHHNQQRVNGLRKR